jgi:hypothetical protein
VFAFSGYVAAIECSSVQVERPSCSTSGGHSAGVSLGECVVAAAKAGAEAVDWFGFAGDSALACFVKARHEATDVQVRQL